MNKTWLMIRHQFTVWKRNRFLLIILPVIVLFWFFALYTGLEAFRSVNSIRDNAGKQSREQWLHQDRKHPHIAAHFGNFAFKPINPLGIFDSGTDTYTGSYVYMEAHRQNDILFAPAQSASALIRFGTFNIALLLQSIIPLLLVTLTFNSILSERLNGTLSVLKNSGANFKELVRSKILAPFLLITIIVGGLYLLTLALLPVFGVGFTIQDLLKSFCILLVYLAYYFIIITLGVYVSAAARDIKQSLMILLGGWVFFCILFPKLLAGMAATIYPLPSNTQFKEAVMKDIVNGIDGHNTSDKRAQDLTNKLLKQYHVDSTSQLPVNIEGVIMMEGEKYSSKVYNEHFDRLSGILLKQQRLFAVASLADPLLGVKNLSMGLSNTDQYNDRNFRLAAERYRLRFVQAMNQDMALHSREDGFTTYKIGSELFRTIPSFSYRPQTIGHLLSNYFIELGCLVVLLTAAWSLSGRIAHKL